jgi:hypothetical protein
MKRIFHVFDSPDDPGKGRSYVGARVLGTVSFSCGVFPPVLPAHSSVLQHTVQTKGVKSSYPEHAFEIVGQHQQPQLGVHLLQTA